MQPPGVRTALAVLAAFSCLGSYSGYTIAYYDCHNIDHFTTYQLDHTCKDRPTTEGRTKDFAILQKASVQSVNGWSCRVTRSRFTDYCGKWGHSKHIATPEIEINLPITTAQCFDMVTTKTFHTPDGLQRPVEIGAETILSIEEKGTINVADDSVSCTGESLRVNNFVIKDVLRIAQYRVIIRDESFLVDPNDQVETASDHLRLPLNTCDVYTHGCKLPDVTYVWQAPQHRCPLEAVRTVSLTQEGDFLRNDEHNILLKPGEFVPSPPGCPRAKIKTTEYQNIFLTKPNEDWPAMTNDLDFDSYVRERDDFVMYRCEQLISKTSSDNKAKLCDLSLQQPGPIRLKDGNVFYRRNGDAIERFECPLKIGQLATPLDTCYEDIPLADNAGFVKPSSRVFTTHSAPVPCNEHHGLKIRTEENVWVELNPNPRQISTPSALPFEEHAFQHEDLSSGGLYTDLELKAWKAHLELGDVHDALVKTITYGHCANTGACAPSPGIPQSNLKFLSADAMMLANTWNFASKIDDFIRTTGGYISAVVIIIEAIKCLNFMTAVALTTAKDGVEGVKALIYSLCCHPHNVASRIARRQRRLDRRASSTIEDLEMLGVADKLRLTQGAGCNRLPLAEAE
jgi:hypothetical protein